MVSREYLLKQAETCRRLANGLTEGDVSRKLRDLAAEYQAQAQEAETHPPNDPPKDTVVLIPRVDWLFPSVTTCPAPTVPVSGNTWPGQLDPWE